MYAVMGYKSKCFLEVIEAVLFLRLPPHPPLQEVVRRNPALSSVDQVPPKVVSLGSMRPVGKDLSVRSGPSLPRSFHIQKCAKRLPDWSW